MSEVPRITDFHTQFSDTVEMTIQTFDHYQNVQFYPADIVRALRLGSTVEAYAAERFREALQLIQVQCGKAFASGFKWRDENSKRLGAVAAMLIIQLYPEDLSPPTRTAAPPASPPPLAAATPPPPVSESSTPAPSPPADV